LSNVNR